MGLGVGVGVEGASEVESGVRAGVCIGAFFAGYSGRWPIRGPGSGRVSVWGAGGRDVFTACGEAWDLAVYLAPFACPDYRMTLFPSSPHPSRRGSLVP